MKCSKLLLILLPLFACGCFKTPNNPSKTTADSSKPNDKVEIVFEQHEYIQKSNDPDGYYFSPKTIAKTYFYFDIGYFLTESDIDGFNAHTLNYEVPDLIGDGYWSFTFFMTDFNEETGFASNYLKPLTISKNMSIYFGIYG